MSQIASELRGQVIAPERIPVIDLAPLLRDNDPAPVAREMLRACQDLGFFYISNHGIDDALRNDYFDVARRFFALPLEEKLKIDARRSNAHRGFFPVHAENNDPDASLDLKEGFDIMAEQALDDERVVAGVPLHGPNQWPEELEGFRETTMQYFDSMASLGEKMMQGIAVALDLPADFFAGKLDGPFAMLRMLHYPPQSGQITRQEIGTGAHTDYGLLTILAQDDNGGLQVQTREGDWIDAPPLPGTFVVNIGDELQRWSNDALNSNPHRVINVSGKERYSAPFFFHAAWDTVIDCLPTCVDANEVGRYDPITAGDYMWQRFTATFAHHQEN